MGILLQRKLAQITQLLERLAIADPNIVMSEFKPKLNEWVRTHPESYPEVLEQCITLKLKGLPYPWENDVE